MDKKAIMWNERYSTDEYVFGKEPNEYLKKMIDTLPAGKILIPAAGEGRDAVYAAKSGWEVMAFDQSCVARDKALLLAKNNGVEINFVVTDVEDFEMKENEYDAIAVIFFHLPSTLRSSFFKKIPGSLKKGGYLIVEAFSPKQLNNTSGGPKETDLFLSAELLAKEFHTLTIIENNEVEIDLSEGDGHVGKADVVRFFAKSELLND
jgi:2-polyprenyl-3-methyl-5-hydroxy-6-metoxy-1,4-benzoquinol methylase